MPLFIYAAVYSLYFENLLILLYFFIFYVFCYCISIVYNNNINLFCGSFSKSFLSQIVNVAFCYTSLSNGIRP